MKDTIQKQLELASTRYGWVPRFVLKNMRLLLLVLFAALALYLVNRVNTLVNSDGSSDTQSTAAASDATVAATASPSISKTPDADVLSTFDELIVQDVKLDSNFEESRENPF